MSGEAQADPRAEAVERVDRAEVERISREFTKVFHDLRKQTFSTTTWLGVQLIKSPNDILVMQQIVNETRPELVVETGVYLGGSALLFASLMDLLGIDGKVIAVDIDLDAVHPKVSDHPRIELIKGSSTDPEIVARIRAEAEGRRTMVDLDSDHRAHHVLEELRIYSPLVTPGCYLIVEDCFLGGRPVRPEAVPGPSEALDAWFGEDPPFVSDRWQERYLLTQNPRGYLRRVGDGAPEPRPPRPDDFMIGALELSGVGEETFVTPPPEEALETLAAAAGDPDLEVEALRQSINNMARADRRRHVEADLDGRRREKTVEALLREIDVQRELLNERNRMLKRDRAQLKRITSSFPYRVYQKVRNVPGLSQLFHSPARRRKVQAQTRNRRRAEARQERTERFFEQHRGQ